MQGAKKQTGAMTTAFTSSEALRLTSAAAAASLLAMAANTAVYCAQTGCRRGLPFVSKVGASGTKEVATLENTLVVSLTFLLAISAVLHHALGNASDTQVSAALLTVPFAIVCVTFDTERHSTLHVMLFQTICALILCILINSPLGLLILVPIFRMQLSRKKSKKEQTSTRTKAFLWGPTLQSAAIVLLVLGMIACNLRAAAQTDSARAVAS